MSSQIRPVQEFVSQNSPEVQFEPIPNQCHLTPQTGQVKNLVADFLKVLLFHGWLCHFKGLFIPVWREIHGSKIPSVTS